MNNNGEFNATFESLDANFNPDSGGREEFYNPSFGSTTEIQIPGPPGPPGDKGDSAYEVAVKNGFEGTEEEWLESLKGKDSDETISAEGIEIALGYKPADEKDIPTEEERESWNNKSEFSGNYDDLSNKPKIPAKISDLENDSDFLTDYTEKDPTVPAWAKQPNKPTYTATDVGADPSGSAAQALKDSKAYTNQQIQAIPTPDVSGQINKHNTDTESHNDIRILLAELIAQVNSFLDVDDTTRDQLSELLRDIDANKTSIESIVSGKVNVADIINNLTTNVANKPLSAAQGVALKGLIDTLQTAVNAIKVPTKTSDLENDSGFLTEHQSLDGYAKTADHYTKTESDNKYQPKGSYLTEVPSEYVTETELTAKGYAKQTEVKQLSEEIGDLSLGMGVDGRLYLLNGGVAQGNGIELPSGATGDVIGNIGEGNIIMLNGDIPDGTYTVKYEMENGNVINIGNMVLDSNVYYSVTNNLTNCTNGNSATKVIEGNSYTATITAVSGYKLSSVKVTMGGTDISSSAVSGGTINIANVTGNIVITAVAIEDIPAYTNLADTSSSDWAETSRLNSSGSAVTCTDESGVTATNYIACKTGDVIRIKGLTLGKYNVAVYSGNKTNYSCGKPTFPTNNSVYECVEESTGIYKFTLKYANTTYIRFSGVLTGTSNDVVITKNEAIA